MKIIDMHTHAQDILFLAGASSVSPGAGVMIRMFEWGRFRNFIPAPARHALRKRVARETQRRNAMANADALLGMMARAGISHSVALPIEPYGRTDDLLSLARTRERLIPFASVDPKDPARAEKLKKHVESGCRGLKLHPIIQNFHPSGPECMETIEEFKQYELPVFFHSGQTAYYVPESSSEAYGAPENYAKAIAAFPSVSFVMGHMAMFEAPAAIEIAERYPNVYFDTSFQPIGMIKAAIDRVGEERVMFGSDWPFGRQRYPLSIVMALTRENPSLREKLLWKNAEVLIGEV